MQINKNPVLSGLVLSLLTINYCCLRTHESVSKFETYSHYEYTSDYILTNFTNSNKISIFTQDLKFFYHQHRSHQHLHVFWNICFTNISRIPCHLGFYASTELVRFVLVITGFGEWHFHSNNGFLQTQSYFS